MTVNATTSALAEPFVRFPARYSLYVRFRFLFGDHELFRIKGDPRRSAVSARVALYPFSLSSRQQAVDCRIDVEVIGLPAPRHHHIGAPKESDEDTAGHFEQRVAVR